jgi:hypothetical protein
MKIPKSKKTSEKKQTEKNVCLCAVQQAPLQAAVKNHEKSIETSLKINMKTTENEKSKSA